MALSAPAGAADPSVDVAAPGPGRRRGPAPSWVWPVLLLGLVVLVRAVPVLDANRPVVMEDELGYLLNAKFLAGVGGVPRFGEMSSYQGGWSLLLVPLWWLLEEPDHVYRAAAALAALLGAVALVPCAGIAARTGAGPRASWAAGAAAVLLPGPVLMGGYVYAEGLVTLLVAVLVLAALRYAEAPSTGRATVVAALAVAAFASHGRAIAFPLLVLAWGVLGLLVRGRRRHGLVAVASSVLGGLLVLRFTDWLVERLYDVPADRLENGLGLLTDVDHRFVLSLAGQLWYVGVASVGLGLLGLVVSGGRAWGELRARTAGPWLFSLGVSGSVIAISSLSFVTAFPDPTRLDYFAYGRYTDSVAPVLVAVAVAHLSTSSPRALLRTVPLTLLPAGLALVLHLGWGDGLDPDGRPVAALSMAGIAVWLAPGAADLPWVGASVVVIVVGTALLLLARRDRRAAVAGLVVVLVGLGVAGELRTMRPLDRPWRTVVALDPVLRALDPKTLAYDTSSSQLFGQNSYQFWLPRTELELVDASAGLPRSPLVVSAREWPYGQSRGARRVAAEVRIDQALYVLPGPLQDDLAARGWLEVKAGETLPADARVSSLLLDDVERLAPAAGAQQGTARVVVDLGHSGTGAVWSPLGTVPQGSGGLVRVLGRATCDGRASQGLGDLPRALVPGERTRVAVLVPVGPGPCEITLQALEEGVSPFGQVATVRLG